MNDMGQQHLLPNPGVTPGDRLRQAGLVGIAQARAALADATRRAEDARTLDHGLGEGRAA